MSDLDHEKEKKIATPPEEEYEKGVTEPIHHVEHAEGLYDPSKESVWTRLGLTFESFKRAPGTTGGQIVAGGSAEDQAFRHYENPMLQQKMKPRHLQMIAVGGSIGTGLFIGSGGALSVGGPGALMLDWLIIGVMVLLTCQAIGEMAILYPLSGGFYALAVRMLDPAWGFAMGWNYVLQWAVTLPLEITAAGITVSYWPNNVPLGAWITIFLVAIVAINVFGTLGYAEEEFWSSCLKLLVVIIFIFIGVICNAGGGPKSGDYGTYVGGRYWHDPGAFANGFKGVCAVFVTAAFSFAGTELVGLAASETPNPRKTMPSAIKNTFWRITIIYVLSLLMIGLLLPYNDEFLLNATGGTAAASPFVRVLDRAHIPGINHLINVTICISVLSIGLSCVFGGSRTLTALAETGYAPKIFAYVDKSGRPLWSVVFILLFGPLAYVNLSAASGEVFAWLVALSGLSTLFTWGSILLCHIRFRKAWRVQGHSVEELPFRAMFGVWGSWVGLILIVLVLIAQAYIAVSPVGDPVTGAAAAKSFFEVYLALPICMACYVIGYLWKRTTPQRAHEIDLDTGRKCWYTVEQMREYRAELAAQPFYKKVYRFLFSG